MSTTTAERLKQMMIHYPRGQYSIDTLEISHSQMSKVYYLTREPMGITANLESGVQVDFTPTQINLSLAHTKQNLDQNFSFTLPDVTNELDDEMDRIDLSSSEPISLIYRSYINIDLSEPAVIFKLQILSITQEKGIFTIQAGAPQFNWDQTGIIYSYDQFPMLRAL